jgi:hypothetical protein
MLGRFTADNILQADARKETIPINYSLCIVDGCITRVNMTITQKNVNASAGCSSLANVGFSAVAVPLLSHLDMSKGPGKSTNIK